MAESSTRFSKQARKRLQKYKGRPVSAYTTTFHDITRGIAKQSGRIKKRVKSNGKKTSKLPMYSCDIAFVAKPKPSIKKMARYSIPTKNG